MRRKTEVVVNGIPQSLFAAQIPFGSSARGGARAGTGSARVFPRRGDINARKCAEGREAHVRQSAACRSLPDHAPDDFTLEPGAILLALLLAQLKYRFGRAFALLSHGSQYSGFASGRESLLSRTLRPYRGLSWKKGKAHASRKQRLRRKTPDIGSIRRPRPGFEEWSVCGAILYVQERRLDAASDCRVTAVLPIGFHVVVDDTGGQKQPLRVERFFFPSASFG